MKTITIENNTIVIGKIICWETNITWRDEFSLDIYVIGQDESFSFYFSSEEEREAIIDKLRGLIRES
jgi:hypothetical protein